MAFNEALVTDRIKQRWTEEEVALMAAEELGLPAVGFRGNINCCLFRSLSGQIVRERSQGQERLQESIRGCGEEKSS